MSLTSFATPAPAATYSASSQAQLNAAITAANADADPTATIQLTTSFSVSSAALNSPSKPITIDTQGFTLSGSVDPSGDGLAPLFQGGSGSFTLMGNVVGGEGSFPLRGEGGSGIKLEQSASVINNGTIEGGFGPDNDGGDGVFIDVSAAPGVTFINNGTVRGGDGNPFGGNGIVVASATNGAIVNTGTIYGGDWSVAIFANSAAVSLNLINSGTIVSGPREEIAILLTPGATNGITLELQAGSKIFGEVVGNAAAANDTLRLGGSGTDSFDVSEIGQKYRNFDTFEKTGTGTWSLIGTGTVATDWDIQDGTLQIGDGSVIGDITNNATLAFNGSDVFTFDNLIFGNGTIRQLGSGKTILTGDNSSFAGNTIVEAGTLSVNGILGGTLDVLAGGRLQGTGQVGTTDNAGTIAPGNSIGTLMVSGDYTGSGGTLEIESVLGDDTSSTDRLVVTGNTSGTTNVKVINLGGNGAQTVEGIKIVDVGGTSAGSFSLLGDYVFEGDQAVVGGAYAYRLFQGGVSIPADGDWYLRSALLYAPGVPLYEAYAGVLQSLNEFGTLRQRTGGPEVDDSQSADDAGNGPARAVWTRIDGMHSHFEPETSTTGTEYDVNSWTLQAGVDGMLHESGAGALIGGLSFHVDAASADVSSRFGKGDIDTTGYGFDGTLTWYGNSGFYIDTQAGLTWYSSDLKSSTLHATLADDNDGFGYGVSVEAGQKIALSNRWSLTPQAQLAYSSVRFDDFTDQYRGAVSLDDGDSLTGRLGISADYDNDWRDAFGKIGRSKLYGIANLYYDFLDGSDVDVSGTSLVSENQTLWGGLSMGGSLSWAGDRYAVNGEAFARTSLKDFGDSSAFGVKVGFSVKW
ncbi:autotransporter outer membrane beta-barrel domain-containing protein [Rhizobium sp. WSM1274]|uniref:autotransporter family protein n=1 Tax=Rhizobium sp. WSM1274 TaxID=3138254 RepID=UPI0021A308B7|nr:autotransporter outer membrane beta-barrel domain-containing protein [Rhizobium leguminosarum]UWU28790.1 autotransporter outer membrane beta-barrel domain-containing protein [Rhizobium leguminosarum bv. viciae]